MYKQNLNSIEPRYIKAAQAMQRYAVSRNTLARAADDAGAAVHYGKSVLYDISRLDAFFDGLREVNRT